MPLVFISHSFEDKGSCSLLQLALENAGIQTWGDAQLQPGQSLSDQLAAAVAQCDVCVFLASRRSIESSWCLAELGAFWGADKRVVIYIGDPALDESALPPMFRGMLWTADASQLLKVITGSSEESTGQLRANVPKVFLCHAKEDDSHVESLYFRLREYGIDPWYDKKKLTVGDRWEQEIVAAIANTDFFAICLSPNSVTKIGFIQRELKLAVKEYQRRPEQFAFLLPVKLAPCDVPATKLDDNTTLADLQWIDVFQCDEPSVLRFADDIKKQFEKTTSGK